MVGASGAIAGVMGAYFVIYPRSRIVTLIPIFIFIQLVEVPAVVFLGIWFLMQFLSGVGSAALSPGAACRAASPSGHTWPASWPDWPRCTRSAGPNGSASSGGTMRLRPCCLPRSIPPVSLQSRSSCAAVAASAALVSAQFGFGRSGSAWRRRSSRPLFHDLPDHVSERQREDAGAGWQTDYPYAENNLLIRFSELTRAPVSSDVNQTSQPLRGAAD